MLLDLNKSWIGTQRRLDAKPGSTWYPPAYVRMDLEGDVTNMSPSAARQLAKALVYNANLIDPPVKRVRKST